MLSKVPLVRSVRDLGSLLKYVVFLRIHLIVPVGYYLSPYNLACMYASLGELGMLLFLEAITLLNVTTSFSDLRSATLE